MKKEDMKIKTNAVRNPTTPPPPPVLITYDIYIQDKYHKTITAANTSEAMAIASIDIKNNQVADLDPSKNATITIIPKNN